MASNGEPDQSETPETFDSEVLSPGNLQDSVSDDTDSLTSSDILDEILREVSETVLVYDELPETSTSTLETSRSSLEVPPRENDPIMDAMIEKMAQKLTDEAIERATSSRYMDKSVCYFRSADRRGNDLTSISADHEDRATTEDTVHVPSDAFKASDNQAVVRPPAEIQDVFEIRKIKNYFPDSDNDGILEPCKRTFRECIRDDLFNNFTPDSGLNLVTEYIRRSDIGVPWKYDVVFAGEEVEESGTRVLSYAAVFGKPSPAKPVTEADVNVLFTVVVNRDPRTEPHHQLLYIVEGMKSQTTEPLQARMLENVVNWKLEFSRTIEEIRQSNPREGIMSSLNISQESLLSI